jgi:hypothetical protein
MTKRSIILALALAVMAIALVQTRARSAQGDSSVEAFWTKFKAAVIKGDKDVVAQLSQFPLGMPYGVPAVKTKAQLIKRYRQVFNGETDAAKCFGEARPVIDPDNRKRFTVGCKNAAGDEVIVYAFLLTKTGWKFKSLDNINE